MGAHLSAKPATFKSTALSDTPIRLKNLESKKYRSKTRSVSSDKEINAVQKLVLVQYPYLDDVKESIVIADCSLPDNPIIFVNNCFERMTLYPKEEMLGRNCRLLQGKHTDQETISKIREAIEQEQALGVEILNYRKDGIAFWNHFLLLPVFKKKKQRYIVAVQKNVTMIKQGNHPVAWTPAELAFWLEHYGLRGMNEKIISSRIDGRCFLALNRTIIVEKGFVIHSEQDALLEASSFLSDNIECPFYKHHNAQPTYRPILSDFVHSAFDPRNPSELAYWERIGSQEEENNILFKIYFQDQIKVFLWAKEKSSFREISAEISSSFSLHHVQLSRVDFIRETTTPIHTVSEFNNYVEKEHAQGSAVHFFVKDSV